MATNTPAMVNASDAVTSALKPYQDQFDGVVNQVLGDPSNVLQTIQAYQDGHLKVGNLTSDLNSTATVVQANWTGEASTAAQAHAQQVSNRLTATQAQLKQQIDSLNRVHEAYDESTSDLEDLGVKFYRAADQLRQSAAAVPPEQVPALQREAQQLGAGAVQRANELKTNLAQVMSQEAAKLRGAKPAQPPQQTPTKPALTDATQMSDWLFACVKKEELGKGGKVRESDLKTVAGPRASMATKNQTIITNAIETLRYPESASLYNQVDPPLSKNELNQVQKITNTITTVHRQVESQYASLLADPDKFASANAASTHLSQDDLKNMLLASAVNNEDKLTPEQTTQMETLMQDLQDSGNLRVNEENVATLHKHHLEDLAGWQRLAANNYTYPGNTQSTGERINSIATAGDHNQIGDIALSHYISNARADYDKGKLASEDAVIKAALHHQNLSSKYADNVLACYNAKKQAAEAAAAKAAAGKK